MKELLKIMIPAEEWGEVKEKWQEGDLRTVVYPLAWLALVAVGFWIGG